MLYFTDPSILYINCYILGHFTEKLVQFGIDFCKKWGKVLN